MYFFVICLFFVVVLKYFSRQLKFWLLFLFYSEKPWKETCLWLFSDPGTAWVTASRVTLVVMFGIALYGGVSALNRLRLSVVEAIKIFDGAFVSSQLVSSGLFANASEGKDPPSLSSILLLGWFYCCLKSVLSFLRLSPSWKWSLLRDSWLT